MAAFVFVLLAIVVVSVAISIVCAAKLSDLEKRFEAIETYVWIKEKE